MSLVVIYADPERAQKVASHLFGLAAPVLISVLFKRFVLQNYVFKKFLLAQNGYIAKPVAFSLLFSAATIANFVTGLYYAFFRIIVVASGQISAVGTRVDMTTAKNERLDPVFTSFLALVQCTNEIQNPIFNVAVRFLCPTIDETWMPAVDEDRNVAFSDDGARISD